MERITGRAFCAGSAFASAKRRHGHLKGFPQHHAHFICQRVVPVWLPAVAPVKRPKPVVNPSDRQLFLQAAEMLHPGRVISG